MKILCFGDSNTYGFDSRSYFGERYPANERWVDILARSLGVECVNLGENGRRIPSRGTAPALAPGEYMIIMLGGNDLLEGYTARQCGEALESFLRRSDPGAGRVLVVAPPPFTLGAWVGSPELVEESKLLAAEYEHAAANVGALFADASAWGVETLYDGVHFSPEGHRAFARGIEPHVRRMISANREE